MFAIEDYDAALGVFDHDPVVIDEHGVTVRLAVVNHQAGHRVLRWLAG
jgi:hypothetical protein